MKTKRFAAVLLAAVMLFAGALPVQAASGYGMKYNGATATPGSDASGFLSAAGKAKSKKQTNSCATKGYDIKYTYGDFVVTTCTQEKKKGAAETITDIKFKSKNVKTTEGIKIGSTEDKVKEKYSGATEEFGVYTAKKGKTKIVIEVSNKKVTSIEIMQK